MAFVRKEPPDHLKRKYGLDKPMPQCGFWFDAYAAPPGSIPEMLRELNEAYESRKEKACRQ